MIIPDEQQEATQVSQHYNELDSFYRELWGDHVHHGLWLTGKESPELAVIQLVEYLADKAKIRKGDHVCDVGCGYGATSRFLAQGWDAKVTGLTISEKQYEYARHVQQGKANPQILLCDWLDNQLPKENFDVAISIESSEHMTDKVRFFNEIHRVLKPSGRTAIYAWIAKENPKNWEVKYLLEPICREGRLPSLGTVDEYTHWMKEAGFKNVRNENISRQVKKTWRLCGFRACKAFFTNPQFRSYLLSAKSSDRSFLKTIFRIMFAYETESMQYHLFIGEK